MAPAPLAADPHAKPPPSLETCIAAYRAQGPLPYGCPVDTPARAVDAEVRECIALFRAGKRLKTWCPADTANGARRTGAAKARAGLRQSASSRHEPPVHALPLHSRHAAATPGTARAVAPSS